MCTLELIFSWITLWFYSRNQTGWLSLSGWHILTFRNTFPLTKLSLICQIAQPSLGPHSSIFGCTCWITILLIDGGSLYFILSSRAQKVVWQQKTSVPEHDAATAMLGHGYNVFLLTSPWAFLFSFSQKLPSLWCDTITRFMTLCRSSSTQPLSLSSHQFWRLPVFDNVIVVPYLHQLFMTVCAVLRGISDALGRCSPEWYLSTMRCCLCFVSSFWPMAHIAEEVWEKSHKSCRDLIRIQVCPVWHQSDDWCILNPNTYPVIKGWAPLCSFLWKLSTFYSHVSTSCNNDNLLAIQS